MYQIQSMLCKCKIKSVAYFLGIPSSHIYIVQTTRVIVLSYKIFTFYFIQLVIAHTLICMHFIINISEHD